MKITHIRFGMLRVPLKTAFKTALRTVEQVEDVVVMVHTDSGHVGYGSAPATAVITGDTHGSIMHAIRHYIAPRLIGEEIANLNRITHVVQASMEKNTSAKAAVEIAVHDLWGQLYGAPLYQLLGGGEPAITTDITISVDYIDKMVADSLAAVDRGFESLKIKVGKDIGVDIERTKAIHAAVEGRALLRLDANQGWTAKQAVYALQTLEDAGVKLELVEQPVKAHDLEGLRYVTERVHTPVMADESVFGPMEVIELIRMRAADIVNIKLMKTGGISNAVKIADICGLYGVDCMIGCMLESSIGVAAAVHLAVAKSDVISKVDLDGPSLCRFDPVSSGVIFNESEISITGAPGLGIRAIEGLVPVDEPLAEARAMSALVKIRSERDRMSAIERRIADFVLDNAQLLRDYSSQQLANALGISQSSVVKFCQKLGFKGYPDLKLSISEAVVRADNGNGGTPSAATGDEDAEAIGADLWLRKTEAEEATRLINPPDAVAAAASAIAAAGKVFIIGLGDDDIHARTLALRLSLLGILTVHNFDPAHMSTSLSATNAGDVLLVFSEQGMQPALYQLCRYAREQHALVVSVTRHSSNPLRAHADLPLLVSAHDERPHIAPLLYHSALQHLLDRVFAVLCESDPKRRARLQANLERILPLPGA